MGKKSRKIRDKKKEWTKLNRGEDAYNEAMSKLGHGYGLLQYKSPSVDCVHGDVMNDPPNQEVEPGRPPTLVPAGDQHCNLRADVSFQGIDLTGPDRLQCGVDRLTPRTGRRLVR
mmetsp:Transcript_13099/g.31975  ORF Transcript_13099/g.31975 Transcript_13099/m.31975 type:complete len:115 (+) Transcript_13099:83-427(+)